MTFLVKLLKNIWNGWKPLPYYLEFPDCKDENGRYLVVSHSHICNVWKRLKNASGSFLDSLNDQIIWDRPHKLKDPEGDL